METRIQGIYGETIGDVTFNDPENHLRIQRWASEFEVHVPITIHFKTMPDSLAHLRPMLDTLWGDVYAVDESHQNHRLGQILHLDFLEPMRQGMKHPTFIKWTGHITSLGFFEKIRDGGLPRFNLSIAGKLIYLTGGAQNMPETLVGIKHFWLNSNFEVSKEIWIDRLRRIGLLENILLEILLPASPSTPWDEVWSAINDARDAFEKGGSSGWKNCVVSVRLALEKWRNIEKEDIGPGGHGAIRNDRMKRTKEQRLDNIRWHLQWLGSYAAHTRADGWTRDDALLMLSTVSALLACRKP